MPTPIKKLITKPGTSFSVVHTIAAHLSTPWHYHPEYELVYMKKGSGIRYIGDSIGTFEEGEMVFVGRNVPQHWISSSKYYQSDSQLSIEGIVVNFSSVCLGENFFLIPEMQRIDHFLKSVNGACRVTKETRLILADLLEQIKDEAGAGKVQLLIRILDVLSNSNDLEILSNKNYLSQLRHSDNRIEVALQFISEHYLSAISLAEIAEKVFMNASAFSRIFKQKTNKTIQEYILDLRIGHAQRMLTHTMLPIERVCYESGFNNLSHFNRIFKRYTMVTPKVFRSKYSHHQK
ncbi:AraC family transcriptional regulator [Puteibacter caeruleilacunae]|nr:AraC family transcriptional regulator [Puteibacter caeruleilacunae]